MASMQVGHAAETAVNIQENSGQIAVGKYVVQIGSVHGGVVNIAMPEEQAHWQPRLTPVLLRPRRFSGLLDRKLETQAAAAAISNTEPLEFYGQPGWGKTTLLRYLAYDLSTTACPDGTVYLLAHQQPPADLLQFLFEAFYESNIPAKPTDAQIRHGLKHKRALILLDDVDLARPDVEALLDLVPQCAFFLASPERRLWGTGQAIALAGLPLDDALALLARELDRPFTAEEEPVAPVLCTLLNGHPLHLLQVAGLVRDQSQSLAEITRHLQRGSPHEALAVQLLAALSTSERRVVGVLATLGGAPPSLEHVAELTGLPSPAPVLESLRQRHLIHSHSPRYSLSDVLVQHWPATWDLTSLAERILTYFTGWAEQQPSADRLLAEADTLRQVLAGAVNSARWPESLRLVRALEGALSQSGRWGLWAEVLQMGLQAAKAIGDRGAKAWLWHQLGTRAMCLDDSAAAHAALGRALRLREGLGDYAGAAVTRHNLNLLLGPPPPPQAPTNPSAPNGTVAAAAGTSWPLLALAGLLVMVLLILGIWPVLTLLSSLGPPEGGQPGLPAPATEYLPIAAVTLTPSSTATATPTYTPTSATPTDTPQPAPTSTNTPLPTPTSTPTHTATSTVTPTPTATPSATPTATLVPAALFAPANLDFGLLPIGETSRVEAVTVTNAGGGLLSVTSAILEGDNPYDYLIDASNCLASPGFPVNRGCTINVRFRPTTGGDRRASLTIFSNGFDSPGRIFLIGRGLDDPAISLSPGLLDFGEQAVGNPSESQSVTVTNTGQGNLAIDRIVLSGANPDDFAFEEACTDTVMVPGDGCLITVQFRPSETDLRTAELTLIDNAPDSPQRLPLRGTGRLAQPDLVITAIDSNGPGQVNSKGEVEVPLQLAVRNDGDADAGLFKVSTGYTGPDITVVVPFTVQGQDNSWYPFTSAPLPTGNEIVFDGIVTFSSRLQGQTISLVALADSCSGDESMPAFCRVEESREDNNLSESVSTTLPDSAGEE